MFDLQVDSVGNATVVPLGTWESEAYCTGGEFQRPGAVSGQSASPVQGVPRSLPSTPKAAPGPHESASARRVGPHESASARRVAPRRIDTVGRWQRPKRMRRMCTELSER